MKRFRLLVCMAICTATIHCSGETTRSPEPCVTHHPSSSTKCGTSQGQCTQSGFTAGTSVAQTDGANWYYVSRNLTNTAQLRIDLLSEWNGPTTAGTYSLEDVNYRDCGLCLLLFRECDESECARILYATEGSVEISQLGRAPGERIAGQFHDVVFREVTLDPDWTSTPVEGGETWCMDGFAFEKSLLHPKGTNLSQQIIPNTPSPSCLPEGNGNGIGANIRDFELPNCNGVPTRLHSLTCTPEQKAAWIVASADWCAPCHQYTDEATTRYEKERGRGLLLLEIIGEDATGAPATLDTCRAYADRHGLPYEHTFYDPHWQTLWKHLYPYPFFEQSMELPWVSILRGTNLEYVYNSQHHRDQDESDVLDRLLESPSSPPP